MRICPTTPEELKTESTIVADRGDPTDLVKAAMYKETGKYDNAWMIFVIACSGGQHDGPYDEVSPLTNV